MVKVALVAVTDFDNGAVSSMVKAFTECAESGGNCVSTVFTAYDRSCHCCGHCDKCDEGGCGDEDCLCTFASVVASSDVVAFAFPCDQGTSMRALDHIIDKAVGKSQKGGKRLMLMSCSPSFEESAFMRVVDRFHDVCDGMGWEYAGEALVEGLPDACEGGDPVSRKRAVRLASRL